MKVISYIGIIAILVGTYLPGSSVEVVPTKTASEAAALSATGGASCVVNDVFSCNVPDIPNCDGNCSVLAGPNNTHYCDISTEWDTSGRTTYTKCKFSQPTGGFRCQYNSDTPGGLIHCAEQWICNTEPCLTKYGQKVCPEGAFVQNGGFRRPKWAAIMGCPGVGG